ncbi:hypothetical protein ACFV0O_31760 [Kitasatospora sp. NPDC059577]|uniref:hypothetical protein n=1 Tax=unclassified Kitasatospora TaxID=2633591 RepID=UPI00369B4D03
MDKELLNGAAPLPGRVGHVGGIESLTLDGRRSYFGFDHASDLVLSPMIDDPAVMAAFASRYLRQTTGGHDAAYWADLVTAAVDGSGLVGDDAGREFTSRSLRAGLPDPGSHLLYLLGAATGWDAWFEEAPEALAAYRRLGFEEEDDEFLDHCLAVVREHGAGERPDEWTVARHHLTTAVDRLPGNWRVLFDPVVDGVLGFA